MGNWHSADDVALAAPRKNVFSHNPFCAPFTTCPIELLKVIFVTGRCFLFRARDNLTKFLLSVTAEAKERESAALEVGEDILNSALAHSLSHCIDKGCGVSN